MTNATRKLAGEVGRLLLVYALIFSQGAWAAQNQKAENTTKRVQSETAEQTGEKASASASTAKAQTEDVQVEASESVASAEKLPGDGKHEGIKVHGHWTIDVKNPDGTVVTHREFENSFIQSPSLSAFLSRTYTVGFWSILLDNPGNPLPCAVDNAFGAICNIFEPGYGVPTNGNIFSTLGVSASGNSLALQGTAVAYFSAAISTVSTSIIACSPTVSTSSSCPSSSGASVKSFTFTSATLSMPIQVSAGQTISVAVTLSFS